MEKGKLIINGVDISGSVSSAASVPYSNTNSGLEATNAQGAIDELATSVTELNSNLDWKLYGTFTGSTEQSLPTKFKELCIIVQLLKPSALTTLGKYVFNIPCMELEDTYYEYKNGGAIYYQGVHHNTVITVAVNKTNVKLVDAKTSSGSDVVNGLNVSSYSVYYR